MVVYWVGMPIDKKWIRIDITRHLELIPRLAIRDLISVKKATPDDNTMKAICNVAEVDARPLSNTIARHEDAIQQSLGVSGAVLTKGVRSKGAAGWLSSLMHSVKASMGQAIGQPSMQSDSYVGKVNQGLSVGRL